MLIAILIAPFITKPQKTLKTKSVSTTKTPSHQG
jgi:hypothetical protein